jgi:hypothetical protein
LRVPELMKDKRKSAESRMLIQGGSSILPHPATTQLRLAS